MSDETVEESWLDSVDDEYKESLSGFESQEKLFEAIGYTPPEPSEPQDWREGLDEDLKKTADRFTSKEDAIRAIQDFRKRDSQVRVPGKDSSDDERTAYYKAIGVPESPEGYELKGEGQEAEATNKAWSERLHSLNVPLETANELVKYLQEDLSNAESLSVKADEDFVKEQDEWLHSEWKGEDYEKNKALANRALSEIANRAGIDVDDLTKIEMGNNRFLMDDARLSKLFAVIGREMAEGTLGSTLTEGELGAAEDELADIRKGIDEADAKGDSKLKNKLYQKELALLAKMKGDQPIVGAEGRAA